MEKKESEKKIKDLEVQIKNLQQTHKTTGDTSVLADLTKIRKNSTG